MLAPNADSKKKTTLVISGCHKAYRIFGKRVLDVIVAFLLLIAMVVPVLILCLVIVMDTPGNPLFFQSRVGKNGRVFRMWKLRTMVSSSSRSLMYMEDEFGQLRHKVKSDPRITRVGHLLRRTSLDELPQLVNVLAGHMSLVGPRPELPEIVANYEPWQHQRHSVLPGITGWWQVSGRSNLPMHENTELDIAYVEGQSLAFDMKIVRMTISSVIKGIGAF